MTFSLFFLIAQGAALFLILWFFFIRMIEKKLPEQKGDVSSLPRTAVIVPVTGRSYDLRANLFSLLKQQHPGYHVFFVTQDEDDAAVGEIRRLVSEHSHATLIYAGKAVSCSQKNHNLIAGSKAAYDAEILVFCDSSHLADFDWLSHLVSPLVENDKKIISSGYHQVHVKGFSIVEAGRAICVLGLRLARMVPGFEQPWGGATAMTRDTFNTLAVASLWSDRVVDDVTLARHMQRHGYSTAIPKDCDLRTELQQPSWPAWDAWLTRQWAYLKFVFPRLWFFLGFMGIMFTVALWICITIIVMAPFTSMASEIQLNANIAGALFLLFGYLLRTAHPQPGSLLLWYPGLLAALIMAGWCHFRTWNTSSITWAGIIYQVGRDGRVTQILRSSGSNDA